jgi:hypothetical protein
MIKIETLYYYYRRNRWMLRPDLMNKKIDLSIIDRPIFITGLQGNGATFVSRVLRRIDDVVTLSGNSKYWSGADEMQSALAQTLPDKFSRLTFKTPFSLYFNKRRGWAYASNEQLPYYKFSELDYNKPEANKFLKIIQGLILLNRNDSKNKRFLDKSQSYALKIPLLRKALYNRNPKFIAIIRNPYAACYRSAILKTGLSKNNISANYKIRIAAEHWKNTVEALLESRDNDLLICRIEDILLDFNNELYKIAKFVELDLKKEHLPSENDIIPYGSKRKERWFPVKSEINSSYLKKIPEEFKKIIEEVCGDLIKQFKYN